MKRLLTPVIVIAMVFTMAVSASAYDFSGYVAEDKVKLADGSIISLHDHYVNSGFKDCYIEYNANNPALVFTSQPVYKDVYHLYMVNDGYYVRYYYDIHGGYWYYFSQSNAGTTDIVTAAASDVVYWTANDIETSDGGLFRTGDVNFFPRPLAELVLELTEEELVTVAVPEMVGVTKVLVPCGVGLMALLVVLNLFGKRSLIFLR